MNVPAHYEGDEAKKACVAAAGRATVGTSIGSSLVVKIEACPDLV